MPLKFSRAQGDIFIQYIMFGKTNSQKLKYIQFILMEDEETKMFF